MKPLDLKQDIQFVNAAEVAIGRDGLIPLRFPQATIDDFGAMASIAKLATGIELQLHGEIREIRISLRVLDSDGYGICAELYQGGRKLLPTWSLKHASREIQAHAFAIREELVGQAPLRFVFPTHCLLEIISVEVDDACQLLPNFEPFTYGNAPGGTGKTWIVHGDSIAHGANVTCPTGTWVDMSARLLGLTPVNLSIGGYGRAELSMARYLATRTDADLLSLHIGTNSMGKETAAKFAGRLNQFLDIVREGLPDVPIFLASPIHKGRAAVNPDVVAYGDAFHSLVGDRRHGGDINLHFIKGLDLLPDTEGLMADCVHLNEFGALRYATNLVKVAIATPNGAIE
jgi:hypothetical protein